MTKNTSAPTFHEQTDGQSQAHKFFFIYITSDGCSEAKKKKIWNKNVDDSVDSNMPRLPGGVAWSMQVKIFLIVQLKIKKNYFNILTHKRKDCRDDY